MSFDPSEVSRDETIALAPTLFDDASQPLAGIPRLSARQVSLDRMLSRMGGGGHLPALLQPGVMMEVGPVEVLWRASGIHRPGVIAQLTWASLQTRLGLGIETPLAHAIVDHLLGFGRLPAEWQRQVTPVEWGILGSVIARAIDRLDAMPGPLGAWELSIDRVGPDPFEPRDLGPIVTWRWPIKLGEVSSSIRLWMPESIPIRLGETPTPTAEPRPSHAGLSSTWRAEAGTTTLARGLSRLKAGGVLLLDRATLKGTVAAPTGPIGLVCDGRDGRAWFEAVPDASGARLRITSSMHRLPTPREPLVMNPNSNPSQPPPDLPVTLVVELGRLNLPLSQLAGLKPGDVVELGHHAREPVELTSNGRLVARGELVQIDTELGVRVTNIFL